MTEFKFKIPPLPNNSHSLLRRCKANNSLQFDESRATGSGAVMNSRNLLNLPLRDSARFQNSLKPASISPDQFGASTSKSAFPQDDRVSTAARSCHMLQSAKDQTSEIECNFKCKRYGSENKFGVGVNANLQTSQLQSHFSRNNMNFNLYSNTSLNRSNSIDLRNLRLNGVQERGGGLFGDCCSGAKCNNRSNADLQSLKSSFFRSDYLPKRNQYLSGVRVDECERSFGHGINPYDCVTRTNNIRNDLSVQLNGSRSFANQSLLSLEVSLVSIKEQVMNSLENFGHALLSNTSDVHAPAFQYAFDKTLQDVKHIFDNRLLTVSTLGECGEGEPLNGTSRMLCKPQRAIAGATGGGREDPRNVLEKLVEGGSKAQDSGVELLDLVQPLVESFAVKKKRPALAMEEDSTTTTNNSDAFLPVVKSRPSKCKVLNLKNWCPLSGGKTLVFVGVTDENVEYKTQPMKKRIDHRNLLLVNGQICRLIGNLTSENGLPEEIRSKLKKGLHPHWRILMDEIARCQRERERREEAVGERADMGKKAHRAAESKNRRKSKERKSPASIKTPEERGERKTPEERKEERKTSASKKAERKTPEEAKTKGRKTPEERARPGSESGNEAKDSAAAQSRHKAASESPASNDSVHVTKSGRVVKAPRAFWIHKDESSSRRGNELKRKMEAEHPEEQEEEEGTRIKRSRTGKPSDETRMEADSTVNNPAAVDVVESKRKGGGRKVGRRKEAKEAVEKVVAKAAAASSSSAAATKRKKKKGKNATVSPDSESVAFAVANESGFEVPEALDDILIPEVTSRRESRKEPDVKLNLSQTPPQKFFKQFRALRSCTPGESPKWQATQHSQSAVKSYEKIRARTMGKHGGRKKKKEEAAAAAAAAGGGKGKKSSGRSKDLDAIVDWINDRQVKSPRQGSRLVNYLIPPKRNEMDVDGDEDEGDC